MKPRLSPSLKGKTFTLKQGERLGVSRYVLRLLLQSGQIEKIGHGLYRDANLSSEPNSDLQMATVAVGSPSAICLLSALSHYHLTDTIPKKIWVLANQEMRRSHPKLRLVRKRDPLWKVGITMENGYAITSLERTIVESLILHRLIGKNEALNALKRALRTKKTTVQKVYNVARLMNVEARVQNYLEALTP